MLLVSPLFKGRPLRCAAFLTLIRLRVLLPTRGDVRTVSPVENGRYVMPTKRQNVAVRVICQPIGIAGMAVKKTIDSSSDVSDHFGYGNHHPSGPIMPYRKLLEVGWGGIATDNNEYTGGCKTADARQDALILQRFTHALSTH
jgi:hypothetical protein